MHLLYVNFTSLSLIQLLFMFSVLAYLLLCGKYNFYIHGFVCFALFQITIQEFSDHRDADEARYQLDGRDVDGSRIVVEFAKGVSCLFNYMISE
jgi:hypothetical protein